MTRYNKTVYWPEWADDLVKGFILTRREFPLYLSDHALRKLRNNLIYSSRAGLILDYVEKVKPKYRNVFEFYLGNSGIRKICHREQFDELYDIILIISENNSVVTMYFNRSDYVHPNLDEHLYEQEE